MTGHTKLTWFLAFVCTSSNKTIGKASSVTATARSVYLFVLFHVDVDNVSGINTLLQSFQQLLLNALLQLSCNLSLGFTLPLPLLSSAKLLTVMACSRAMTLNSVST